MKRKFRLIYFESKFCNFLIRTNLQIDTAYTDSTRGLIFNDEISRVLVGTLKGITNRGRVKAFVHVNSVRATIWVSLLKIVLWKS